MSARIALLRGINVGGNRTLPMADLRGALADAGFAEVRTYIQSGNVFVTGGPSTAAAVGELISQTITEVWGYDVPVVIREASVLPALLERSADLFPVVDAERHDKLVHVAFLSDAPTADAIAAIDPERSPGDSVVVDGVHAHVHYGAGAGTSKLTGDYLERSLGVRITMRNLTTVRKLIDLADRSAAD